MSLLRVTRPEHMPVLGLLVSAFLERAIARPQAVAQLRRLEGDLWLRAGQMWITLRFDGRGIEILSGRSERHRAAIEGEMDALLLAVASSRLLDRARSLPDLARGRLKLSGHPGFLLRLAPLFIAN